MKTATISQKILINALPNEVYHVLLDAEKHAELTGGEVEINPVVQGKFSIFDGYCKGYTMELIPDKRIVQAWNFAEEGWPEDHFSICIFELSEKDNKTELNFTQTKIPAHKSEDLKNGWKEFYWDAMETFFG